MVGLRMAGNIRFPRRFGEHRRPPLPGPRASRSPARVLRHASTGIFRPAGECFRTTHSGVDTWSGKVRMAARFRDPATMIKRLVATSDRPFLRDVRSSLKSLEVEEDLDLLVHRPLGLVFSRWAVGRGLSP